MELFPLVVLVAAALCGLVAGFLFGFAVVAMPGLKNLSDREFIRAFQVMDRVIQDRQPLFMVVWVGSVVALLVALAMGFQQPDGFTRGLLIAAAALYVLGVQVPTARVHLPLNNEIQTVEVEATGEVEQKQARERFEARWNRSNRIRTVIAVVTMLLLLVVLVRLPAGREPMSTGNDDGTAHSCGSMVTLVGGIGRVLVQTAAIGFGASSAVSWHTKCITNPHGGFAWVIEEESWSSLGSWSCGSVAGKASSPRTSRRS